MSPAPRYVGGHKQLFPDTVVRLVVHGLTAICDNGCCRVGGDAATRAVYPPSFYPSGYTNGFSHPCTPNVCADLLWLGHLWFLRVGTYRPLVIEERFPPQGTHLFLVTCCRDECLTPS